MEARFVFKPTPNELAAWNARMDGALNTALTKFSPYGTQTDETTRWLDAMQLVANNQSFASARSSGSWDSKVNGWLGQHPPSMRTRAQTWLQSGKPLSLADMIFHLGPAMMNQQSSVIPDADAKDAGIGITVPFSIVIDAQDTLRIAGPIDIWPTALITKGANAQAAIDVKTASDVPSALAIQLDCDGLASTLIGGQGFAYSMCDKSCVKQLCEKGLASMWTYARDYSQKINDTLEIHINGSGPTVVGEYAEPLSMAGGWSGQVKGGQYNASTMQGNIKAAKGMAPN
jgi:hypothetical protein